MNIDLRKKAKKDFGKDCFKLINKIVFGKTIKNVRKHRYINIVTTEARRNYLVSEPSYYTTKFFTEKLLAIEMKKNQIYLNKPVYLGLLMLDSSKIVMYGFWYDYVKPIYGKKAKLCYIGTDSFIVYIKTNDMYKDIVEDVETRFDTSNYELDRPLTLNLQLRNRSR